MENFSIVPIASCIYPIPRRTAVGVGSVGSEEERIKYTKYANTILKGECMKHKILFFDIYNRIVDNEGFINTIYTKDGIHLDYTQKSIHDWVEEIIFSLL